MASFKRMRVRLGEIRPSAQNPREDFGDIEALAAAIEATGGEPVNPPVLVRDGNVFRIVDGERRYRALRLLHADDEGVDALVLDDYTEAAELVAMMATDDKKALSEAERSRGVQQMLVLGVDEETACKAGRATEAQVRAVRRVGDRLPGGYQPSLEQMEAAARFEDEADVDAVLGADEAHWRSTAAQAQRRVETEREHEAALAWLAAQGIEVMGEEPEGEYGHKYCYYRDIPRLPEDVACLYAVDKAPWMILLMEPEDGAGESEEEAAARAERDRISANVGALQLRAARFAADVRLPLLPAWPEGLREEVLARRGRPKLAVRRGLMGTDEADKATARLGEACAACAPGHWEARMALAAMAAEGLMWPDGCPWAYGDPAEAPRDFLAALDVFERLGFEPTEEDEELRGIARAKLAEEDGE